MVSKSGQTKTLTYPARDLAIVADAELTAIGTLSVSFSGDETGDVDFEVTALDARGCLRGTGTAIITIRRGRPSRGPFGWRQEPTAQRSTAARPTAAGRPSPAAIPRVRSARAARPARSTARRRERLHHGRHGRAGALASTNADCAPGSQCFDYARGLRHQVCLRFCDNDSDCRSAADGGVGPGSFCRDPVSCGGTATALPHVQRQLRPDQRSGHRRAQRLPGRAGLPAAGQHGPGRLRLPESTRTKPEGTACGSTRECAPGLDLRADLPGRVPVQQEQRRLHGGERLPDGRHQLHAAPGEVLFGVCL